VPHSVSPYDLTFIHESQMRLCANSLLSLQALR